MKVIIPESLNDITLGQYLKFKKVIEADDISEGIYKLAVVSIFCKLKVQEAQSINLTDFDDIYKKVSEVLQQEPTFKDRFIVDNIEFGFIPNLDEITAGEYIDIDTYSSKEDGFVSIMGVLFRPITNKIKEKYSIEDYESSDKYIDYIERMPLGVALGANVFFYTLSKELLIATQNYLEQTIMKEELEAVSEINGVGINQFIQSLEETSLNLQQLCKPNYMSFSHS